MRRKRVGFTIVEVSLFLAVTALLFVGITAGVQSSIFQQRYNDSVQNFVEFLRSLYAETMNVQNSGDGRSGQAIYGKLAVFGEQKTTEYASNTEGRVYVYDVIGNVSGNFEVGASYSQVLGSVKANILRERDGHYEMAGMVQSYLPKWGARIESKDAEHNIMRAAVLVMRHPRSGTVNTLVADSGSIDINLLLEQANGGNTAAANDIHEWLASNSFSAQDVDFCISPEEGYAGKRRDVRIDEGANNSSGIEVLVDEGGEDGNRCL